MKFLRIAGLCLLALVGVVVLLYLIGVAANWRDRPPSAAALEMKALLRDRPPVADTDNGFVYAMGFSVPATADPQTAGVKRVAWLEAANRDPKLLDADPVADEVELTNTSSPTMRKLREICADDPAACGEAFVAARAEPRNELEQLMRARYFELVRRPRWREVVSNELSVPMARFGDIVEGQRLAYVDLAARAKSAPPGEIAQALRDDFAFWRETQKSADLLITKMIAVAALRQHFFFGNLVLREAPGAQATVMDAWSAPFSIEELSMRRVMSGEIAFSEGVMLKWHHGADQEFGLEPDALGLTLMGRIGSSLSRPFYNHQDQMNYYSASYLDFAKRFEVPLGQYERVAAEVEAMQPAAFSFHVYNPVGHIFRSLSGMSTFVSYPPRVGSIEGMRRAALLTAQLRARGVQPAQIAEELVRSELRDPFDQTAFEWSDDEQAVVYQGPEAERSRRRHPYSY